MFEKGLFLFHRDFRLVDNVTLNEACSQCKQLYLCFIFTPEQVGAKNTYKSNNAVQFMIESLQDLQGEIEKNDGKLILLYGNTVQMVKQLIEKLDIQCLFFNRDYTPFAVERRQLLETLCSQMKIECISKNDYYLYEPGTIKTMTNTYYKKFTPFYDTVLHKSVPNVKRTAVRNLHSYSGDLDHKITLSEAMHKFTKENPQLLVHGGRTRAIQRMRLALLNQDHYDHRDILTYSTTFLSAYIKFGCISIREVYHKLRNKYGLSSGIVRQLLWREYYGHVLFAFPDVVGQSYQPAFRKIKWSNSEKRFELWKRGQTGFPIVDAGMRQMNATGYMHNRVRMMTASFLIKVLHIDWRWGEKYFAQKLTDYDVANNNGNWQEISGTGVDMKPYFRDMSPWVQSIKFDSKAEYIKKWVPELKEVDPMDIHKWYDKWSNYKDIEYPKPIVDYHEEREKMLKMYKDAL